MSNERLKGEGRKIDRLCLLERKEEELKMFRSCVCLWSAVDIVSEEARREPSFPLVQRVCVMTLSLLSPSVWAHARPICRSVVLDNFYLSSTSFCLPAFLCRSPAYCLSCIWSIAGFNMLCCLLRLLSYVMNKSFAIYNLMHLFCLSFLAGFLKTQDSCCLFFGLTDFLINSTQWLTPPLPPKNKPEIYCKQNLLITLFKFPSWVFRGSRDQYLEKRETAMINKSYIWLSGRLTLRLQSKRPETCWQPLGNHWL